MKFVRPLTPSEIALARPLFGAAVDYAAVRVHRGGYLPFGLQGASMAMAPNGHLYFGKLAYRADFSQEPPHLQMHFMHEMAHVWQHSLGYRLRLRGAGLALRGGYLRGHAYRYDTRIGDATATPAAFNMEQQADLIAHYFGARTLRLAVLAERLPWLEQVLVPFLRDPCDPALLPDDGRSPRAARYAQLAALAAALALLA